MLYIFVTNERNVFVRSCTPALLSFPAFNGDLQICCIEDNLMSFQFREQAGKQEKLTGELSLCMLLSD